jgi:calcium-dependent protein kinase
MFVGETQGKLKDFYRIGKVLGSGAFGEVRIVVQRETGIQRAVKVMKKVSMKQDEID